MNKYQNNGVTPEELLLRQEGKCWLEVSKTGKGDDLILNCTDGVEYADTSLMLNPTIECAKCLSKTLIQMVKHGCKEDK